MRLPEHKTSEVISTLEERMYGNRLSPAQLAQKAGVAPEYVSQLENQIPVDDHIVLGKIADALGVTPDLLHKIAGLEEMSEKELRTLERCLGDPSGGRTGPRCAEIGLWRPV